MLLIGQPDVLASEPDLSASFDGINDYLIVSAASLLSMTTAVSIEFWAKRRTISRTCQVPVCKPGDGQSKNENYSVWLNTGNRYQAYFGNRQGSDTPSVTIADRTCGGIMHASA